MNKLFAKFRKEFEKVKGDMDDETSKKFADVFEDIDKEKVEEEPEKVEEKDVEEETEKEEETSSVEEDKKEEEVVDEEEDTSKEEIKEEETSNEKEENSFDIEKLDEIVSKLVEKHLEKKSDVGLKPMGGKVVDYTGAVGEFR